MALILIVDDEDYIRSVIEEILREVGHDVVTVRSGEEAVRLCEGRRFDLVITDLSMPGMDGLELIHSLRSSHEQVPVLAVSGAFDGQFLKVATTLGAVGTLDKPFTPNGLLGAVDKILGKQPKRPPAH
jgi:CheY-like chemotaxis protein